MNSVTGNTYLFYKVGKVVTVTYLAVIVLMVILQRQLLYFPSSLGTARPSDYGTQYEEVEIVNREGLRLNGWWISQDSDDAERPVLLYCHGNGAVLSALAHVPRIFQGFGWDALLFNYRAYGKSEGEASSLSEEGVATDAQAAYDWLKAKGIPDRRIVIWGHSLGSAVAARLASQNSPAALILEHPFPSLYAMARHRYPWALIFPFMLRDRYETSSYLESHRYPVMVLHAEFDRIVPLELGKLVFEQAAEPKRWILIKGAGHEDFPKVYRDYEDEIVDFVKEAATLFN